MERRCRVALGLAVGLVVFSSASSAPRAAEYRLRVASMHEEGFYAHLRAGELEDGAAGPGLDRLEQSLDAGEFPLGVLLGGRDPAPARETIARVWKAVPVQAAAPDGTAKHRWAELRWEGTPGQHSVFVIDRTAGRPQELGRVALRGTGPMRQYQVVPPTGPHKLAAIKIPLAFIWAAQERGDIWTRYVAPALDVAEGIGVVVGSDAGALLADHVYLVVRHGDRPTVYKAVLAWRPSPDDRQAPLDGPKRLF